MLEHTGVAEKLQHIRELTDEFAAPEDACATWRAYYTELKGMDRDLREHIHLENNVLFPRALTF